MNAEHIVTGRSNKTVVRPVWPDIAIMSVMVSVIAAHAACSGGVRWIAECRCR